MTPAGLDALKALRAIADPGTLAAVLAITSDDCSESAERCAANWQDPDAGRDWREIAYALRALGILRRAQARWAR